MPRSSRLAFTMLELLVVISIMTVLAAMILVGASAIMGNAEKKKTETIIQTVKTGIELAIANKGSAISPTEHPFAGSNADAGGSGRFRFVRASGNSTWGSGSPVSTTGTALKGVPNILYLSGGTNQLMMVSDRYQDERIVLLHGARREDIGVLQSLRKVVTKYRLLPMPPKKADGSQPVVMRPRDGATTGNNYQGDTNTDFPDTLIPSKPQLDDSTYGRLSDTKPALDYLFGNSSAQSELASLKALYNADPTLPEDQNKFRTGIESRTVPSTMGASVVEPLVYSNANIANGSDMKNQESNKWKPGYIPVSSGTGTTLTLDNATGTRWVRYRLAGLAVYDAWNNELMTVTGSNNSYRVVSAGQDGALAVDPGPDNHIDGTTISVDATGKLQLDPKDKDGTKDNL